MIKHYLNIGLAQYTGIQSSKVEILYDTLSTFDEKEKATYIDQLLTDAYELGVNYPK